MRKRFLTVFCLLAIVALRAEAQITITHTDFLGPGTTLMSHQMLSGASFDVGGAGASQQWTFGDYEWEYNVMTYIENPASTPFAESFPTATRAIHGDEDGSYVFEQIVADACYMLGTASDGVALVYDDPLTEFALPATYQSHWSAVIRITQELEPGVVMTVMDSSSVLVDGWGTVTIPFGQYDVLRFASHHYSQSFMNGELLAEFEFLSYAWVNQDGIAVVNVDSDLDNVDPNFDFGVLEMNEYPMESTPPVSTPKLFTVGQNYPNPFNGSTMLPLELQNEGSVNIAIYDGTGRLISERDIAMTAGSHAIPISGQNWASGNYFARVKADEQVVTKRMLLLK